MYYKCESRGEVDGLIVGGTIKAAEGSAFQHWERLRHTGGHLVFRSKAGKGTQIITPRVKSRKDLNRKIL
jgi:hypothetical protein